MSHVEERVPGRASDRDRNGRGRTISRQERLGEELPNRQCQAKERLRKAMVSKYLQLTGLCFAECISWTLTPHGIDEPDGLRWNATSYVLGRLHAHASIGVLDTNAVEDPI
jgi:hypothetical protein